VPALRHAEVMSDMSQIAVRRPHQLPLDQARALAERLAGRLRNDFGGSYAWDGDTLCFRRTAASGRVTVLRDRFELTVELGLLLRPFQGRIEREIETFCDAELGPADGPRAQPARPTARRSAGARSSRSQGASRSVRPK
jgi:putative polyhydroxyalkanoate system protein